MPRLFAAAVHVFVLRGGQVLLLRRFVAASVWTGAPSNCEPDKCDELRWSPRDELPANTIPYVRRALENYDKGVWFEEFGF